MTTQPAAKSAETHQFSPGKWVPTTCTRWDGEPITTVEDVAQTTAYSARRGDLAELHAVTLDDADETGRSTVVCYTGNGPRAVHNARLIAGSPQYLSILEDIVRGAEEGLVPGFTPQEVAAQLDADNGPWLSRAYLNARAALAYVRGEAVP